MDKIPKGLLMETWIAAKKDSLMIVQSNGEYEGLDFEDWFEKRFKSK